MKHICNEGIIRALYNTAVLSFDRLMEDIVSGRVLPGPASVVGPRDDAVESIEYALGCHRFELSNYGPDQCVPW